MSNKLLTHALDSIANQMQLNDGEPLCPSPRPLVVNSQVALLPIEEAGATIVMLAQQTEVHDLISAYMLNDEGSIVSLCLHSDLQNAVELLRVQIERRRADSRHYHDTRRWRSFSIMECLEKSAGHFLDNYKDGPVVQSSLRNAAVPLVNDAVLLITVQSEPEALVHYFDCCLIAPNRSGLVLFERGLNTLGVKDFFLSNLVTVRMEAYSR